MSRYHLLMLLQAAFLIIVGLILPFLAIQSDRYLRAGNPIPPRREVWRNVLVVQWALAGVALLTAWRSGIELFPAPNTAPRVLWAAAGILIAALLLMILGHRIAPKGQLDRLIKLVPESRNDLGWWVVISATAGITEEIVYRGVLYQLLLRMVGEAWLAAIIAAAVFAITHLVQGALGAAVIFVFALAFHWLVHLSKDLYTAIAVHALYDFAGGLYIAFVVRPQRRELQAHEPAPVEPQQGDDPP